MVGKEPEKIVDIGLICLPSEESSERIMKTHKALRREDILDCSDLTDGESFGYFGFPSHSTDPFSDRTRVGIGYFAYHTIRYEGDTSESEDPIDPAVHLLLGYGKSIGEDEETTDVPDLEGMKGGSGSGIWTIPQVQTESVLTYPETPKLVAVQTQVKEDTWIKGNLLSPSLYDLLDKGDALRKEAYEGRANG